MMPLPSGRPTGWLYCVYLTKADLVICLHITFYYPFPHAPTCLISPSEDTSPSLAIEQVTSSVWGQVHRGEGREEKPS